MMAQGLWTVEHVGVGNILCMTYVVSPTHMHSRILLLFITHYII